MGRVNEVPRNERIRSVREATGLTQLQFLARLNEASRKALGAGVRDYSQSTLSKLESGAQDAGFEDVAVFATADPLRRGKLWFAWGEKADATMQQPPEPVRTARGVVVAGTGTPVAKKSGKTA